jgi:hypothetical protein
MSDSDNNLLDAKSASPIGMMGAPPSVLRSEPSEGSTANSGRRSEKKPGWIGTSKV